MCVYARAGMLGGWLCVKGGGRGRRGGEKLNVNLLTAAQGHLRREKGPAA